MDDKNIDNAAAEKRRKKAEYDKARRARMSEEQKRQYAERTKKFKASMSETKKEQYRKKDRESKRPRKMTLPEIAQTWKDDESAIAVHNCGLMNIGCSECESLNFLAEKPATGIAFSQCCSKGKVKLEPFTPVPDYLQTLLTKNDTEGRSFRKEIRTINSSFAFASFGAKIERQESGPQAFRIHGQIYHATGALHPRDGQQKVFAQLYILDPGTATEERLAIKSNEKLQHHQEMMHNLAAMFQEVNPFAQAYRMLYEVEQEEQNKNSDSKIMMAIRNDRNSDPRRYNAQRVSEVAIVFDGADGQPPFNRDIIIHLRNSEGPLTRNVNILNKNLDAMTYPIFFPYADQGWDQDILMNLKTAAPSPPENVDSDDHSDDDENVVEENLPQVGNAKVDKKRVKVTMMQYYSFRLSVRPGFNRLLSGARLTEQYICDAFGKIEGNRANWVRMNQPKLRVENYNCLLSNEDDGGEGKPGRQVILPSTFEGSPRNMQQRYQDAMAIMTKFGKPDYFITMTCNPNWVEITSNLEPYQTAQGRPDLVARVFNIKLNALFEDIKKGLFGKVVAKIHVIEYQKRGLPHAHILLIVDKDSKVRTCDEIDKVVCAEIPDVEKHPRLHSLVLKHMIHGPCGPRNPNSPCMENFKCTKKFPKPYQEKTNPNVDGYALYRRRKGNQVLHKNEIVDNSNVVPYNPYLLLKYECHINIEVCSSIRAVKYLFKYVYKGHDCANIEITDENKNDEILQYLNARYVSSSEAMWRIFGFGMHSQSHATKRLDVHLPDEQLLYFNPDNIEAALDRAESRKTTLMAWFQLNKKDENAKQYYYWQIPEHYTFSKNTWNKRKRGTSIGRMYNFGQKNPELYFLRTLLLHVKGAISFEYLRTVRGVEYATFREAAIALGVLLDDSVWQATLNDAIKCDKPKQFRQLFAYICVLSGPTSPKDLYFANRKDFLEDFCFKIHKNEGDCINCEGYALREIEEALNLLGKTGKDFELPDLTHDLPPLGAMYDPEEEEELAMVNISMLNEEQRKAFNEIENAMSNDDSNLAKCYFLDGPGGSGKTFLYNTLIHYVKSLKETVLSSATTGIAANLLPGGRTFHSMFGIPLILNETSISTIKPRSKQADEIRKAKILQIDESPMLSNLGLNTLDRFLDEIMGGHGVPFGGKVILFGGDFRQCLAIVPHASKPQIIEACCKNGKNWNNITKLSLVDNMRSEDPEYIEWLLRLGNGTLDTYNFDVEEKLQRCSSNEGNIVEIPSDMIVETNLIKEIYGENISSDSTKDLKGRAILCPKNDDVDNINEEILKILEGEEKSYASYDEVLCTDERDAENFPVEYLNSLTPSGFAPHNLKLKVGAIVILLRNLNTKKGLCNGTRLIVTRLEPNVVMTEILTGSGEGEPALIPRIDLTSVDAELPFKLKRRQFPIKLAFAMTINKAQGQTLEKVGIFLREPVFAHGQLYVAFSRVRRRADVKIQIMPTSEQGKLIDGCESTFTRNVVYYEVL